LLFLISEGRLQNGVHSGTTTVFLIRRSSLPSAAEVFAAAADPASLAPTTSASANGNPSSDEDCRADGGVWKSSSRLQREEFAGAVAEAS